MFKACSSLPTNTIPPCARTLQTICSAERLSVNTDALTRLADRAHLDVRSCLNTLQFVARRASSGGVRNASAALLTAVAEGVKDDRRDLFQGMCIYDSVAVVLLYVLLEYVTYLNILLLIQYYYYYY